MSNVRELDVDTGSGGVEVVSLATQLRPEYAEQALVTSQGAAFLGVRVATMNADGNLFLVEHPVARLAMDEGGRVRDAEPVIHRRLPGFVDVQQGPPGEMVTRNKHTPFVWADAHY